ncbi:MAG TPA: glycerophosphodiester phosphodiesterase [Solirubrobacteraceae bacterium]|nr:glycerophosphodiester phosphodiesterase [Solirubrobacteraceae bacterium]
MIAHRGASAHAPENTLEAFDLALEQGADVLELDVRCPTGRDMVCVHDPPGDGAPAAPCLDAVLGRYGTRTRYLVDLKDPAPAWERRVVAALHRHGVTDRAMVQSFDLAALGRLRAHAPALRIAALYRRADSVGLDPAAVPPFACAVGVHHPNVDARFVAGARARGLAIHPWTVDDADEAARLLALGVDAVITNAPDVIVRAAAAARRPPGPPAC